MVRARRDSWTPWESVKRWTAGTGRKDGAPGDAQGDNDACWQLFMAV